MVHINDDYVILVDKDNFTLAKDLHKTDKKGKPRYSTLGFYMSLTDALAGFVGYSDRVLLSKADMSLTEAVNRLRENHERIAGIIAMEFPNVEVREKK